MDSPTHAIDCYKNQVGLEIEWNNKDSFFDRDLNNFRLLFELRVISVGVIVTRCDSLQNIFERLGRGKSYGASTTHMSKLLPKIDGGGGGGCPLMVFGIKDVLYDENCWYFSLPEPFGGADTNDSQEVYDHLGRSSLAVSKQNGKNGAGT